jgi:2-keto-4-pentenoate hydratase/2-oxohepta-3-ene-1,7-dioic acid hydratase in catechol pathway
MRIARISLGNEARWVRIDGDGRRAWLLSAAPWAGGIETGEITAFAIEALLPPVEPFKILCVGRNYVAHAKELGNEVPKEPLLFFKPKTSLVGHGGTLVLPVQSERVEHEAELGVVIGKRAKSVTREDAMKHVYGYTIVNDVTARDLQKKDGQWARAKGFDGFCPTGPWIETELDPRDVAVRCRVNGAVRQDGRTSNMVFDVAALIAYASAAMTLEPGDLLVTGTPEGVGPLVRGDRLETEVEGIGVLETLIA